MRCELSSCKWGSFYRPGAEARVSAMAERLAVFPPNGYGIGAQAGASEVIGDVQARRCFSNSGDYSLNWAELR